MAEIDDLETENTGYEPEAFPVAGDEPVEGPPNVEQPPPDIGPASPTIDQLMEAPAPAPVDEVDQEIAANPAPEVAPAEAPGPIVPGKAGTEEETLAKQAELDRKKASVEEKIAKEESDIARQRAEDERIAQADYIERRKAADDHLDAKVKEFEQAQFMDPRKRTDMTKARLSVIFGGLGAAFRSAGGGDSSNHALQALQKQWDDDADQQRANIGLLKDKALLARTRANDVDDARAALRREADAQQIARYNSAIKQGEAQLKGLGLSQAEIDNDKRVQSLKIGRAAALQKAREADDKHAKTQAEIAATRALERLRNRMPSRGSGGGAETKAKAAADKDALTRTDKIIEKYRPEVRGTNKSPGPVKQISRIQAMRHSIQDAMEKGDDDALVGAITSVIEEGGSMMSGGKTTNTQADLLKDIQTAPEKWVAKVKNAVGKKEVSHSYANRFVSLLNGLEAEKVKEREGARSDMMEELLGEGGAASTPAAKSRAMAAVRSIFGEQHQPQGAAAAPDAPQQVSPEEKMAAAQRVVNDPTVPLAVRQEAARHIKARIAESGRK